MGHPQIDTGLGFTCDKEVLPVVLAFYKAGVPTKSSCQNTGERRMGFSGTEPRAFIAFHGSIELLSFCVQLRENLPSDSTWGLLMQLYGGGDPRFCVAVEFTYKNSIRDKVIATLEKCAIDR